MPQANKLSVIGIGYRPLGKRERDILLASGDILASSRLFEVFKQYTEFDAVRDRIKVINKVPDTIAFIRDWFSKPVERSLVLLASGDPLFFGIGRRMLEEFGNERVEIFPDLSSVQTAFARINTAWDDAFFISLHGGPDIAKRRKLPYEVTDIPWLLERHGKLGILTDRENNPNVVARILNSELRTPHSELLMHVCERLGYADERIISGTIDEMAGQEFADPNVVILELQGQGARGKGQGNIRFGLKEEEISHERGLITKDEVRAVTLHKLRLPHTGVLWDIGAGSGSISLEAGRLSPGLAIFAVEKDEVRARTVRENTLKLQTRNVQVIQGSAPEALADLLAPDRVFIGGSGGNLAEIVKLVNGKMASGVVVINAASLDTLNDALDALDKNGFTAEVSEISVSRSKIVAGKRLMNALNPVFIITGEKG